jgi:hypothetical protein
VVPCIYSTIDRMVCAMSLNALFWLACVPTRLAISAFALLCGLYGAWTLLAAHAVFAVCQVLGFLEAIQSGRTKGRLGGLAWWSSMRPVHITTHTLFVVMALLRVWWCGLFLFADTVMGVAAWFILRPRVLRVESEEEDQQESLPNLSGL